MTLYDWITRQRRVLPRHSFRGARATLRAWPALTPRLRFSATYHDAWISYPERLGIELILDTQRLAPRQRRAQPCRDRARRRAASSSPTARPATRCPSRRGRSSTPPAPGWTSRSPALPTRRRAAEPLVSGTKGSHLDPRQSARCIDALSGHMIFFENADGRVCIVFPYLGKVLAGSTDIRVERAERVRCEPEERDYILDVAAPASSPTIAVSRRACRLQLQRHPAAAEERPRLHRPHLARPFRPPDRRRRAAVLHGRRQVDDLPRLRRAGRRRGAGRTRRTSARADTLDAGRSAAAPAFPQTPATLDGRAGAASFGISADARRAISSTPTARGAEDVLAFCLGRADDQPLDDGLPITTAAEIVFLIRHEFVVGSGGPAPAAHVAGDPRRRLDGHRSSASPTSLADELGWDEARTARARSKRSSPTSTNYHGVSREMLDQRTKDRSIACA